MSTLPTKSDNRTADRVLDVAERLVQTRGFNSFSYADIAKELGITTASLHYHYPGKAELGKALIARYAQRFGQALDRIDTEAVDPRAKLEAYTNLHAGVLKRKRMCMCGILAAEYETLPKAMRHGVITFFDENQRWLAGVLAQGKRDRTLRFEGSADEAAQAVLSTLEGAMLVSRPYGDLTRFNAAVHQLLVGLSM